MKKIFLSFAFIAAFAVFATAARRNVGVGLDRFLSPDISMANPSSIGLSLPASPIPSPAKSNQPMHTPGVPKGKFADGTYTGSPADAFYGTIQVQATVRNGLLADVQFLQYPNDRDTSRQINGQAMPYLKSEAIQAQSAQVDIVSGATDSSLAFQESLASALQQAAK